MGGCEEEKGRVQTQVLDEQGGCPGRAVGLFPGLSQEAPPFPGSGISHFVQTFLLQGLIGPGTCRAAWLSVCLRQRQHVSSLCAAMASHPLPLRVVLGPRQALVDKCTRT